MFGYFYDLGRPRFGFLERTPWRDSNAVRGVAIGGVDVSEVKGVFCFCFCGFENPSMCLGGTLRIAGFCVGEMLGRPKKDFSQIW